jgi:hypothetical protein
MTVEAGATRQRALAAVLHKARLGAEKLRK